MAQQHTKCHARGKSVTRKGCFGTRSACFGIRSRCFMTETVVLVSERRVSNERFSFCVVLGTATIQKWFGNGQKLVCKQFEHDSHVKNGSIYSWGQPLGKCWKTQTTIKLFIPVRSFIHSTAHDNQDDGDDDNNDKSDNHNHDDSANQKTVWKLFEKTFGTDWT